MTLLGKIGLSATLLIALGATALTAYGVHIEGDRRAVFSAGVLAFVALSVSLGVGVFDLAYRWTRRALREIRQPTE
jgi:hypothetical protein